MARLRIGDDTAAERNKGPILEVLRRFLPTSGTVLEVASGTGQHAAWFASQLPDLTWVPSEADPELVERISQRLMQLRAANLAPPLHLNVCELPWPVPSCDAIVAINLAHVAPVDTTRCLLEGAGGVLAGDGILVLYGPFLQHGEYTAETNRQFDRMLKARDARWGLRDIDDLEALAAPCDLSLHAMVEMPANNTSLVFRKGA